MLAIALLALAPTPQACNNPQTYKFTARGTLQGVTAPLPSPLGAAANGDPVTLELELDDTDYFCSTAASMTGVTSIRDCAQLTVGGVAVGQDPASDACIWGERMRFVPTFAIVGLNVDMPLDGGLMTAQLRANDPNQATGLGFFDGSHLTAYPIDVATVTDPLFSANIVLVDGAGAALGSVNITRLELLAPTVPVNPTLSFEYCASEANSTGVPARMRANGSRIAASNAVTLTATDLPPNSFGYFLASTTPDFIPHPGGSSGNLCLGGLIGRWAGAGQIQFSGTGGTATFQPNLTAVPTPIGAVGVVAGQVWSLQYWFRDAGPTGATSNFSSGTQVAFI